MSRRTLTFREKVSVLEQVDAGGRTKEEIATEHGISVGYVYRILRNRRQILKSSETKADARIIRSIKYQDIERKLLEWLKECQAKGSSVRGKEIKTKAIEIAISTGCFKFPASNGWLMHFQQRHKLDNNFRETKEIELEQLEEEEEEREIIHREVNLSRTTDNPSLEDARLAHEILTKYFKEHPPPPGTAVAMQQIWDALTEGGGGESVIEMGEDVQYIIEEEEELLVEEETDF